ncbi:MAG: ArnT family glycosyltransferase [Anaerolineae bacterium]
MKPSTRRGMVLVLLVAALLRLGALPDLPVGLHYDEAANLILTRQIVDGARPLFIRGYTGKEVLFFYAAAPWVWMTGGAPWGLRLGAAMLGLLTIAATFAAVRSLFHSRRGSEELALIAAGWIAVAFPHVLLSRYGFRAIAQPLLQGLAIAALWRGLRTRKPAWLAAAGAVLGLTAYTYLAARLFPVPLAMALAWLLVGTSPPLRVRRMGAVVTVLVVAAVVFAPLGLYFLRHPDAFLTRIAQVAAPSWAEAARGIGLCLRALVWPGGGDPYVRFNRPGLAVMDVASALFAALGLAALLGARRVDALESAGRCLVVSAVLVMILPSALATGEITPSNLRMAGLFPLLGVLPAWGIVAALRWLTDKALRSIIAVGLLVTAGARTAWIYGEWASGEALFKAADGAMVLAAQALDDTASADTTVYIAGEHYRHPTVAALASRYPQARWLTGGATLVLPSQGRAVYLVPEALAPPAPWPETIAEAWITGSRRGPGGHVALRVHTLAEDEVTKLRGEVLGDPGGAVERTTADFAHIVLVHDAAPLLPCRVAEPCPILVVWEPQVPAEALQPVVRLRHPETGEWTRTMDFHYASNQWSAGELVLDQLVVTPPVGTPPGDGYQVGVAFFDTNSGNALSRLRDERFAGLEVLFPQTEAGFSLAPMDAPPEIGEVRDVCHGVPKDGGAHQDVARQDGPRLDGIALLGRSVTPSGAVLSGRELEVRLCWQALVSAPDYEQVRLVLTGETAHILFAGSPAEDYGFSEWRPGEVIEGRYRARLPRDLAAGTYGLDLYLDDAQVLSLVELTVQSPDRSFTVPDIAHPLDVPFGGEQGAVVRLLGYDLDTLEAGQPLSVTLYWQSVQETPVDYRVFLHLRAAEDDELVAQVDEMPQAGDYPTSLWVADEVVTDVHALAIPPDLPPGDYHLTVGLYLPVSGEHLRVETGDADRREAYRLTTIEVSGD